MCQLEAALISSKVGYTQKSDDFLRARIHQKRTLQAAFVISQLVFGTITIRMILFKGGEPNILHRRNSVWCLNADGWYNWDGTIDCVNTT